MARGRKGPGRGGPASIIFPALLGILSLWLAASNVARDVALAGDRPTAPALVLSHSPSGGARTAGYRAPIHVRLMPVGGSPVETTLYEYGRPSPRVGTMILVCYDPAHPSWFARQAGTGPTVLGPLVQTAFGALMLVIPVGWLRRRRAARE